MIIAKCDAFNSSKGRYRGGLVLKYDHATPVVWVWQTGLDTREDARKVFEQWANADGTLSKDGWHHDSSGELLYAKGDDYYRDDVMTFEIAEGDKKYKIEAAEGEWPTLAEFDNLKDAIDQVHQYLEEDGEDASEFDYRIFESLKVEGYDEVEEVVW